MGRGRESWAEPSCPLEPELTSAETTVLRMTPALRAGRLASVVIESARTRQVNAVPGVPWPLGHLRLKSSAITLAARNEAVQDDRQDDAA
jgi:hypothetical protein